MFEVDVWIVTMDVLYFWDFNWRRGLLVWTGWPWIEPNGTKNVGVVLYITGQAVGVFGCSFLSICS